MPLMKVRDTELNVEVLENKGKQPTVFLHGNLASNSWWKPSLEHWSGEGDQPIVLIEWRGYGQSKAPDSLDQLQMPELAKDTLAVMERLDLKNCDIVGHSTGGIIALCAVLERPEYFRRMLLLDTVGPKGFNLPEETLKAFDTMAEDKELASQVMAGTIRNVDPEWEFFKKLVEETQAVAKMNWSGVPYNLNRIDISDEVGKIQIPTLVLHGDEDQTLPIAESENLAKLLPKGRFQKLEQAGHSYNVEQPQKFMEIVTTFFGGN